MKMNASRGAQIGILAGFYIVARDYSDGKFLPWAGSEAISKSDAISQNIVRIMGSMMFMVAVCTLLGAAMGWGIRVYQRRSGKTQIATAPEPKP